MFYLKLLICIIIQLRKEIKKRISYFEFFFKNINIFKFFIFKFNREINPFYSKKFQEYIELNRSKIKKISNNTNENKNLILVESFINQPAYTLSNGIISFYLNKIFKGNIVSIIRQGDIKSELIFRSFGVKKFFYYKDMNFLQKIIYLNKALKFIGKKNNINSIVQLQYKKVNLGLTAYDSYIRYVGNPTLKKINFEFMIFISEALYACDFFENMVKKNNFCKLVQSETSFIPLSCLFQTALQNKIEVFSRFGKEKFTVRRYTNLKQSFSFRGTISQKLFDIIFYDKKNKKIALKVSKKIQSQKIKTKSFGMDVTMYNFRKNTAGKKFLEVIDQNKNESFSNIDINKKFIKKEFNWDNKKIVVFFLSYLIDGNFPFGYRKNFKDTFSWINFVLSKIENIKNVNWIIKDHPIKKVYGQSPGIDFEEKLNYLNDNFSHIKRWPKNFSNKSILNIADIVLTSSGTAGIEYPAYGINSIFTEKSSYSNLNFMKMIEGKKKILSEISNLNKIKRISSNFKEKCKVYLFIRESLLGEKSLFLPDYVASRKIEDDEFWTLCIKKVKKYKISKDKFFKMFKKQMKFNSRHTLNYNIINFENTNFEDFND
tara:strand:+ start:219 stop:2021 length:1803 start_codon:yes stop_codon:yes gene_type:complete